MKQLKFEIENHNWSMMGPHSWNNTIYKIYNDLSINIIDEYNGDMGMKDNPKFIKKNLKISQSDYNKINVLMLMSRHIKKHVDAYDGEVWNFTSYNEGKQSWQRGLGYIYGIITLEAITNILDKYHKIKHFDI